MSQQITDALTHDILILAAAGWLRRQGCAVVITDMSHGGRETPDAIGWKGTHSTLIECKASLSDFRADAHKPFRRFPERGMGDFRYYCTPRGLIPDDEVPIGWGVLEWDGKKMWQRDKPVKQMDRNEREELSVLLSALRRIGQQAPAGVSIKFYTFSTLNRATLGIAEDDANVNTPPQPRDPPQSPARGGAGDLRL